MNLKKLVAPPTDAHDPIAEGPSYVINFDAPDPEPDEEQPRRPNLTALLVRGAFERAVDPTLVGQLGQTSQALCICVEIPDTSWEEPLRQAMSGYRSQVQVLYRDPISRRVPEHSVTEGYARSLQMGGLLICASPDLKSGIPSEFRSAADATIDLGIIHPEVIADVIGVANDGQRPSDVPPDLGTGLNLRELAACLRLNEASDKMVARIQRAMKAKYAVRLAIDGPRLEDLAGYGAAADWGLRLRDGVAAYRAGKIEWVRMDTRAILYGPPGTGKSHYAAALSRTLGTTCIQTSVGQWFARNAGDLGPVIQAASAAFQEARAAARANGVSVLFVDEVDSLPDRSRLDSDRGSWWRPLVNLVLSTMDGSGTDLSGVVLLAATNTIESVDPALLRPGRFGTHLPVLPPGLDGLAAVLVYHLGGSSCRILKAELMELLRPLVGATPAQAAQWARDALDRAKRDGREVDVSDVARVVLPVDSRPDRVRRRVAVHEAGHAVVGLLTGGGRLLSTSIVATAAMSGCTVFEGSDESVNSRSEIEAGVVILLAGRAADVVVGDGASAGAGGTGSAADVSDLAQATGRLTAVHAQYGMGGTLRYRGTAPWEIMRDGELARLVEADLQRLMRRAEELVAANASAVRAVTEALLARHFLSVDEVRRIVEGADSPALPRYGPIS